jgi:hypothetical protein
LQQDFIIFSMAERVYLNDEFSIRMIGIDVGVGAEDLL